MRFKHFLTLVAVAGCSELSPENASEESQQVFQEQPGEMTEVPTDDASDRSEVTYALAKQDLPPCNPARENRLFYTKAEDAFFVCSGESKSWEQVNLKGPEGRPGSAGEPAAPCQVSESGLVICGTSTYQIPPPEQGPQGPMGPQGAQGAKGDQGVRGERGEAGAAGPTGNTGAQGGVGPAGPIGPQGPAGASGKNSLIKTVTEAAGPNCAAGGQKILVGIDDDGDGVLQAGEEDSASFVCNGAAGADSIATLTEIDDESPGSNCLTGGKRIRLGLDNGDGGGVAGNGQLESGEADKTDFICGSAPSLKVLAADGTPLFRFVSLGNILPIMDSSVMEHRHLVIVKHLTLDAYTAYYSGVTRYESSPARTYPIFSASVAGSKIYAPGGFAYFQSSDCSGPAYIQAQVNTVNYPEMAMMHFHKLRPFHFSVAFNNSTEMKLPDDPPSVGSGTYYSRISSSDVCTAGTYSLLNMAQVSPLETSIFPQALPEGWYLGE